jgi:hypothetical protein
MDSFLKILWTQGKRIRTQSVFVMLTLNEVKGKHPLNISVFSLNC